MLILEIKQIMPAAGVYATYEGEFKGEVDRNITQPVILWAICRCQEQKEEYDAILGFVSAAEEGLLPAEEVSNFMGYETEIKFD